LGDFATGSLETAVVLGTARRPTKTKTSGPHPRRLGRFCIQNYQYRSATISGADQVDQSKAQLKDALAMLATFPDGLVSYKRLKEIRGFLGHIPMAYLMVTP
jgi:hypothetical protein